MTNSKGALGSKANPLTESDFPFTVPEEGVYWIKLVGRALTELPVAPVGAVLAVEVRDAD